MFDRDTAPGAEPEDLLRLDIPALIVPGQDAAHATSAARYLEECLPRSEYWDVPVAGQTEEPTSARLLEFLDTATRRIEIVLLWSALLPRPVVDDGLIGGARHRHVPLDRPVVGVVEALARVGLRRGVQQAPGLELVRLQQPAGLRG